MPISILILASCVGTVEQAQRSPKIVSTWTQPNQRIELSWETGSPPHPERAAWSDALIHAIQLQFPVLDKAKDITQFCPGYEGLSLINKERTWGELMVADAYFESSFIPTAGSVDAGVQTDRDTWSIGLWQVSVDDQVWIFGETKYSYDDLLTPGPNAELAVAEIAYEIKKTGLIVVHGKPIFSTLFHGKDDKTDEISSRVRENNEGC